MDWSKVDAALAGALADAGDDESRALAVFVHVDPAEADPAVLAALGVDTGEADEGEGVRTATLSPAGVDRLTDEPWVRWVRLAGPLRLLGGD